MWRHTTRCILVDVPISSAFMRTLYKFVRVQLRPCYESLNLCVSCRVCSLALKTWEPNYLFSTVFSSVCDKGWLVEFTFLLMIMEKRWCTIPSHGPLNVENESTPCRPHSLHFDSTYIHVNPGDIFKPVTNYSLPHRPADDRGVPSLIGGLCSHSSLTTGGAQPVVPFIYRVTGRLEESCCEGRSLVLSFTNHRSCQVYSLSQSLVRTPASFSQLYLPQNLIDSESNRLKLCQYVDAASQMSVLKWDPLDIDEYKYDQRHY